MAASSLSLSSPAFLSLLRPKPPADPHTRNSYVPLISSRQAIQSPYPTHLLKISTKSTQILKISAVSADTSSSDAISIDDSQKLVSSSNDDGVSTIVSVLLFIAFLGLLILTVGVVYLAVTDLLQKRETEKFKKEEAANSKKKVGKRRVKVRAGPRGFGQKIKGGRNGDDNDE